MICNILAHLDKMRPKEQYLIIKLLINLIFLIILVILFDMAESFFFKYSSLFSLTISHFQKSIDCVLVTF